MTSVYTYSYVSEGRLLVLALVLPMAPESLVITSTPKKASLLVPTIIASKSFRRTPSHYLGLRLWAYITGHLLRSTFAARPRARLPRLLLRLSSLALIAVVAVAFGTFLLASYFTGVTVSEMLLRSWKYVNLPSAAYPGRDNNKKFAGGPIGMIIAGEQHE